MVHILFTVQHKTCPKWVTGLKWGIFFISLSMAGYLWSFVKRALPDNDFNLLLNYKLSIKNDTLYSMSDIKYGQKLLGGQLA